MKALWGFALLALVACEEDGGDNLPKRDQVPASTVPSDATASASAAPKPPPAPPVVTLEALKLAELTDEVKLHTIEGAVLLSMKNRVGRLSPDGGKVEWVGKISKGSMALGDNVILRAFGKWPEEVAVSYVSSNPRALVPTYHPLKGGGGEVAFNEGGGPAEVFGHARIGETTTIFGFDYWEGHRILKVRGPMVKPTPTPREKAGCKAFEDRFQNNFHGLAVTPRDYAATRAGTAISVGTHCKDEGLALEIWSKPSEPSKIVGIGKWLPNGLSSTHLLQGPADTIYVVSHPKDRILRYQDGKLAPLPKLKSQRRQAFVSAQGTLFATDRRAVYELVKDAWQKRAELAWPNENLQWARLGKRFVATRQGELFELKPTEGLLLEAEAESVACKTPFVHLYEVNDKTSKSFRFPATTKGLSGFAHLDRVQLVDFEHQGRRIGIVAEDWKTAKAVVAHVKKTLPEEHPHLLCFSPKEPRVLEVKGG